MFIQANAWVRLSISSLFFLALIPPAHAEGTCYTRELEAIQVQTRSDEALPKLQAIFDSHEQPNGAILTADGELTNPDYLKKIWVRDLSTAWMGKLERLLGARTEEALEAKINSLTPDEAATLYKKMSPFVKFLKQAQEAIYDGKYAQQSVYVDRNGKPIPIPHQVKIGNGEPVLTKDGEIVSGNPKSVDPDLWGRPQNDGPGRALTVLAYITEIGIKAGKLTDVQMKIINQAADELEGGIGKDFANYVKGDGRSHVAKSANAWEEQRGHFFDTALAQAGGMYRFANATNKLAAEYGNAAQQAEEAAKAARAAGDLKTARKLEAQAASAKKKEGAYTYYASGYNKAANEIANNLPLHWDPERKAFVSGLDVNPADNNGHNGLHSQLDTLTIVSLVQSKGSHLFVSLTDDRVLSTVHETEKEMREIMPKDSIMPSGATPMGRDMKDRWIGDHHVKADPGEYPWFLTTADTANFYSSITKEFIQAGQIKITALNRDFFADLMGNLDPRFMPTAVLKPGAVLKAGSFEFSRMIRLLDKKSTDYMKMLNSAIQPDGTTGEGFGPIWKDPKGPRNLTWNIVEYERALAAWKEMNQTVNTWVAQLPENLKF